MRVIAGSHKGRRLLGPKGQQIRPTSDRVKEALFSILGPRVHGTRVLDLYAGTGAIGIEALSRGAQAATFVETNPVSLRLLRSNLERCGLTGASDVQACPVETFLRRASRLGRAYDIVFADPPYDTRSGEVLLPSLARAGIITADSIVIVEHRTQRTIPLRTDPLIRVREYRYGDTTLSVFGLSPAPDSDPGPEGDSAT